MLSEKFVYKYQLHKLVINVHVYINITCGMYGLPQDFHISYDTLVKNVEPFEYHPIKRTPGLWKHKTCPAAFCLDVDYFGVKCVGREHVEQLANAIKTNYNITCDW